MKWSPDVVSRSAKWCEMEVWDGAIRQRVLEVRDRAKVQRWSGVKQWDKTNLSLSSGGKTSFFFRVDTKVLNTNDK